MAVIGFVLIGIGAALWNTAAIPLLAAGVFRTLAGWRMSRSGPPPWFMGATLGERENVRVGRVGILSGITKVVASAMMLGAMVWLATRDWHLWGQTLSIPGRSSAFYLEVVGTFVTSTAAASFYIAFRSEREHHRPAKQGPQPRRRERDPRKAQSRATGTLLIVVGAVLCAACVVLAVALVVDAFFTSRPPYFEIVAPVLILSGPAYAAGQNLMRRGRRHFVTVLSSHEQLTDIVLYLRWFREDSFLDRAYPRAGTQFLSHFLISGASEEEQLVRVLKPYGRVVAVGDPTEALPRVGADRFYLPFEGWQEPVRELMAKARLVVLSLGMGEGTLWELVQAMSTLPPHRLILLVPMDSDEYEAFRRKAHPRLPEGRRLPEYRSEARSRRRSLAQANRAAYERDLEAADRRMGLRLDRAIAEKDPNDPIRRILEEARDAGADETSDAAKAKSRTASHLASISEGVSVATAMSHNSQFESVIQAVVHFPTWETPIFTRLDTVMIEGGGPTLFRDPRRVALENCLLPALRRIRRELPAADAR